MDLPLRILYSDRPVREPAAWFIPGGSPAEWLEELARWGVSTAGLELCLVPQSLRDRRVCGVLVVPEVGTSPRPGPRALAYGRVAGRLFVPVEARLEPECTERELHEKLPGELLVLHPTAGLVAFESSDIRRVRDLLLRPPQREATWDRADPGLPPLPRLTSIEPLVSESPDAVIELGHDDIGSRPTEDLPPAPNEPSHSALSRAGRWLQQKLAAGVQALAGEPRPTSQAPPGSGPMRRAAGWVGKGLARFTNWLTGRGTGRQRRHSGSAGSAGQSQPGWRERMRQWAARRLEKVTEAIEAARNRELHRLLHLMESNPDEALQFAPSLAGRGGIPGGPPSSQLARQNPNFDLHGSTGPVDPWSVDSEMRRRLVQEYRKLADREVRLGRHRRAAYVLAHLLGDVAAAAAVLAQGEYFRDAAVLYRDRLGQPLEAARCLERAGLWSEAVAIYESQERFEEAGDLYGRLQMPAEAAAAYRKALVSLKHAGDLLAAARLLETKLQAPEEALALLAAAWPSSHQATPCLQARFELLGRLGRHADARQLASELPASRLPRSRIVSLVKLLAIVARSYPDEPVRCATADAARVIAGRELAHTAGSEKAGLVRAITRLAPDDRLLARDGERFLVRSSPPTRPVPAASRRGPAEVGGFELDPTVHWKAAAGTGEEFWVAGLTANEIATLVVMRVRWDGTFQRCERVLPGQVGDSVLLATYTTNRRIVWVQVVGDQFGGTMTLAASENFPTRAHAISPRGGLLGLRGLATDDQGTTWTLGYVRGDLALYGQRCDGYLATSRHVLSASHSPEVHDFLENDQRPLPLLVHRDSVFVGVANQLVTFYRDRDPEWTSVEGTITGLVGTWSPIRPRVAVLHDNGGIVLWTGMDRGHSQAFGTDRPDSIAGFTRSGLLVVASRHQVVVFSTEDRQIALKASFVVAPAREHAPVLAILPTELAHGFAIIRSDGTVRLYNLDS